jgi:phosphoglycolate phosphatase
MKEFLTQILIFDLDGTLVDSSNTVLEILNGIRYELKKNIFKLEDVVPILSLGGEDMIKFTIENNNDADIKQYLEIFRIRYNQHSLKHEKLYPFVFHTLAQLRDIGIPLAICTNKPKNIVQKVLIKHSIYNFFDIIIDGNDVKQKKPNPEGLQMILNYKSISAKNAVFVGDSRVDQNAANKIKIPFIWHESGYDDGVDTDNIFKKFKHWNQFKSIFLG